MKKFKQLESIQIYICTQYNITKDVTDIAVDEAVLLLLGVPQIESSLLTLADGVTVVELLWLLGVGPLLGVRLGVLVGLLGGSGQGLHGWRSIAIASILVSLGLKLYQKH